MSWINTLPLQSAPGRLQRQEKWSEGSSQQAVSVRETYPDILVNQCRLSKLTHLLLFAGHEVDLLNRLASPIDGNQFGKIALKDIERI